MAIRLPDLGPLFTISGGPPALNDQLGASTLPLALFPVRLETRFFPTADGSTELRVRMYPDKVHINSHDPALTADEVSWGQRYWTSQWQAGTDDGKLRASWRMLAARFGPERGAWIARALTPLNIANRPTSPPKFPALGAPATITRTARVGLMPPRWVATAYADGAIAAVATGADIPADLAIGPDLSDAVAPASVDDETPAIDEGMRWMVDFHRAEQVGMALRIPLSGQHVDVLTVVGMRPGDASPALAGQFDAHHYTDGLAFLSAGTPTNNTDNGRSPYRSADPRQDQSYTDEWLSKPGPDSAAARATKAFGVHVFDAVAGCTDTDAGVARAMTTALWPATWGYYLAQMIGFGGPLTVAGRDWLRGHAIHHVRPGGPLPLLRCGRQPYGILPVTSLDAWRPAPADPGAGTAGGLRELLVSLRDTFWRPASSAVRRVGLSDAPSNDLIDVLTTGPLSWSYLVRGLMGQHFLQHLWAFLGFQLDSDGYWAELLELATQATDALGITFVPAVAHAAYQDSAAAVSVPLVGDPGYLADLRNASIDDLATIPTQPAPLLQVLLRHALLRQYDEAAARLLQSPDRPFARLVRDAELVDLLPDQAPTPTWSWRRSQTLPGGDTVAHRLATAPGNEVTELRGALDVLATATVPALERHLAGTLDAASHRLDAWVTSLASRRLGDLRATHPTGITVGGYGWVENLQPAPAFPDAPPTPDEPAPLLRNPADPGFIHTPSLNQASAAALLRNTHLTHGGQSDSPYAIDLSSARVRLAKQLFDGVRQGQPLGALLGYLFERSLHESGLDALIDDFRGLAPLPGAAGTRLVVDGLSLSTRWQADRSGLLDSIVGLPADDPRRETVARALDSLGKAVDSAADAVTAEGAFQMLRGNVARAAASLDAISSGQAPPPDLGFVRTPRTGVGLTHRVAMLFAAAGHPTGHGWATTSPRAAADPVLAAWAERLLGPATGLSARVTRHASGGAVTASYEVPVPSLNIAAIDFIWAAADAAGGPPELIARTLDAAVHVANGPDSAAELRADLTRLANVIELATRAQRLLSGARPIDAADLQPVSRDPKSGLDLADYQQRVGAAEQALAAARDALSTADGDGLRTAMLHVAAFGVPGAVPTPGLPVDVQARALLPELTRRLTPLPALNSADEHARRDRLLERMRAVFGPGFLALPHFAAANAAALTASRADRNALHADDPLAEYTWLHRMERVRPPLARMTRALVEASVLGRSETLDLSLVQVPHVPGQRWIGLDFGDGAPPPDGSLSLILQGAPADLSAPLCGLLVDEVTEVVPSKTETTGIALQYGPPDSAAPQSILLAVPPVLGQPWTVGTLNRVVLETFELVRIRGVDPTSLADLAHYVPATSLAFNAEGDAVSSDLNRLVL